MPVLFPPFVGRWGNAASGRFLFERGVRIERMAEMWRAYASLTEHANQNAFVHTLRSVVDPGGQTVSAMDRLYLAAHVPTLIVWGDRDTVIPVRHAYAAHEAIPGSRLKIIEGVGHFPHVERRTDLWRRSRRSSPTPPRARSTRSRCGRRCWRTADAVADPMADPASDRVLRPVREGLFTTGDDPRSARRPLSRLR